MQQGMSSSGETTQAAAVAGAGDTATAPVESTWSVAPLLEAVTSSCAAPSGQAAGQPASVEAEAAAAVASLAEAIAAGFGCLTRPEASDGQVGRTYVTEAAAPGEPGAPGAASEPAGPASDLQTASQVGAAAAQPGGETQSPPVGETDVAPSSPERVPPQAAPAVVTMSPEASVPLRPSRSSKSLLRPIEKKWDHDLESKVESKVEK